MAALSAVSACDASQLCGGRSKLVRCPLKFAPHPSRCLAAAGSASVEMPGGVFWLDKSSHSSDVVYGEVRMLCPTSCPWWGCPGIFGMKTHRTSGKWSLFFTMKNGLAHATLHTQTLYQLCTLDAEFRAPATSQRRTWSGAVTQAPGYGAGTARTSALHSFFRWAHDILTSPVLTSLEGFLRLPCECLGNPYGSSCAC